MPLSASECLGSPRIAPDCFGLLPIGFLRIAADGLLLRLVASDCFRVASECRPAQMEESTKLAMKELPEVEWESETFECSLCLDAVEAGTKVRHVTTAPAT